MARFDLYAERFSAGYLLDVQADLLSGLNTRVVVPLMPVDRAPRPAGRLNPTFVIGGSRFVMVTQFLAAVSVTELGKPSSSLAARDHEILDALDMLISGF